ncbi:uncharacterized protein LOC119745110 [Patiria miniata]|uniref:Reverse transcriptase domain-containing protein n=1 Tax=Patiria miniata TaxID=46514 RepID=A0A914BMT8_PATMI|nr:uncharacterized protein LOC119745110 [Patiria miniata]
MDIVALSETRWLETGSIKEKDCTIFWNGKGETEAQVHGVGFAVKNSLLKHIDTPVGISPRLLRIRIHTESGYLTLLSVYAPTLQADEDVKDSFYRLLEDEVRHVPARDSLRSLLKEVLHTRAIRSTDWDTDHCLVLGKIRTFLKKLSKSQQAGRKRTDREGAKNPEKVNSFLKAVSESCGEDWEDISLIVHEQALRHFGSQPREGKDWFTKDLLPLVEDKREALLRYREVSTHSNFTRLETARQNLQRETRKCANQYWLDLCQKIQVSADTGNLREMYDGIKTAIGPTRRKVAPLRDLQGNLLTDTDQQLQRWTEHYSALYGSEPIIDLEAIDQPPDLPCLSELDFVPTVEELLRSINDLSNNKATGTDGIPAEIIKVLAVPHSPTLLQLHRSVVSYWQRGQVPQCLKDAQFIQLYKNTGDKSDCNNYRGISLLDVFGKSVARLVLKRLQVLGEYIYPESQCGFRSNRSTIDMVFTLRQLEEKCREIHVNLYIAFVDLTKAFDTVSRAGLYRVLVTIGCPPTLLKIVQSFHDGMEASISFDGDVSDSFSVRCGVKQGCVIAPCLFNIYFSYLLHHAFDDNTLGVYLHTRFDEGLFNVQRFRAKTKVSHSTVTDLLFADNAALFAHTADDLQTLLDRFTSSCAVFGLKISESKTVVMCQEVEDQAALQTFLVNGKKIAVVDEFCYLGSCISSMASMEADLNSRIVRAAGCFGQLRRRVWANKKLRLKTKIAVSPGSTASTCTI